MLQRLFLLCISVRWLIAALFFLVSHATKHNTQVTESSVIISCISFCVSLGFVYQVVLRNQFGRFGGPVWWAKLRYIHSTLWFLSGLFALFPNMMWWLKGIPLTLDATVGTLVGILHYKFLIDF